MAKDTPGTELVIRHSNNIEALEEFDNAVIWGKRIEFLDDPQTIQREILLQLQAASSLDELEPAEAVGWRTLLGVPIELKGFRWLPSDPQYVDADTVSTVFVVVFGTRLDDGSPVVLTTGGVNVLIQLSTIAKLKKFPLIRALKESKPSRLRDDEQGGQTGGFKSLWLFTPEGYAREAEVIDEAEVVEVN
jgi:hypothetical protein